MLNVLKNDDGYIYAYVDWTRVNEKSDVVNDGDFIYIKHIWVHERFRNNRVLKILINLIDEDDYSNGAKFVYWNREKYNKRQSRIYLRKKLAMIGVEI